MSIDLVSERQRLLERAAALLWGRQWHRQCALELGVSEKAVRRWVSGEMLVPVGVIEDMAQVLEDREGDFLDARLALRQWLESSLRVEINSQRF